MHTTDGSLVYRNCAKCGQLLGTNVVVIGERWYHAPCALQGDAESARAEVAALRAALVEARDCVAGSAWINTEQRVKRERTLAIIDRALKGGG